MFVEQTCGTLACDGCAKAFGDADEGGSWHFDDLAAALKTATDCEWEVTDDRVLCPECVEKRTCDAEGHDWSPWMGCLCGGEIDGHEGAMTTRRRYCGRDHCHANEREDVVGECEQRYEPTKLSDGARLIEHRRNWYLITAAQPERDHAPHDVPAAVEDLRRTGRADCSSDRRGAPRRVLRPMNDLTRSASGDPCGHRDPWNDDPDSPPTYCDQPRGHDRVRSPRSGRLYDHFNSEAQMWWIDDADA